MSTISIKSSIESRQFDVVIDSDKIESLDNELSDAISEMEERGDSDSEIDEFRAKFILNAIWSIFPKYFYVLGYKIRIADHPTANHNFGGESESISFIISHKNSSGSYGDVMIDTRWNVSSSLEEIMSHLNSYIAE